MTPDPTASAAQSGLATVLILDARSELLFFKTAAHLEAYVEAVDVASGEYGDCWDAEGRSFKLYIESRPSMLLGIVSYRKEVVRVTAAEDRASHLADLHLALLRHLAAVGLEGEMPVTNDTADLLAFALEHAHWS